MFKGLYLTSFTLQAVVGYYTSYSGKYDYTPNKIPAGCLNCINYAFARATIEGTVIDDNSELAEKNIPQLIELRQQHDGLRLLITIGGQGENSDNFSAIAASQGLREKFAKSAAKYMNDHKFDGVDIDWEVPGREDTSNFTLFVQALRKEIGGDKFLTIAVGPNPKNHLSYIDFKAVTPSLDWVNLMAYDYTGKWAKFTDYNAPLYGPPTSPAGLSRLSVSDSVQYLISDGVKKSKIYMGIPFYGREFSGVTDGANSKIPGLYEPFSKEDGAPGIAYKKIMKDCANCEYSYDSTRVSASLYGDKKFVVYDNEQTVRDKCAYIRSLGLGGAMIWALPQEDPEDSTLLKAVYSSLQQK